MLQTEADGSCMKKTSLHFTGFLLLFVCACLFATCAKEYSNEGGPKKYTAKYSLVGAGDSCRGSVLAGKYYTGKALSNANTIQLQVTVDSIGSYNVVTNTNNGFQFSASGNFTNTGLQTITLTGAGTPAATGDFIFNAAGGGAASCRFTVSVSKELPAQAAFTMDCQNINVNGSLISGTRFTVANSITLHITVTAIGAYSFTTDTLDGIYFSASGIVNSTGDMTLELAGYGTPEFARNLLFTIKDSHNASCSIKVTVTDAQPLAVYVLESGFGNPSPCIYTVNGIYKANTPLNASNTVLMSVYVSYVGNFTVSTAAVNGMQFSYSGSFTTTGAQKITLQGSGTPTASGSAALLPEIVGPHPLGGQTCGFNIPVQ